MLCFVFGCSEIICVFLECMQHEKLYEIARTRHGHLNRDVVHDAFCQFGEDLPTRSYLRTCINNADPKPYQERFDAKQIALDANEDPFFDENLYGQLVPVLDLIREKYTREVDTFLACKVNGSMQSFSERSGISKSVLEKICNFVKYEILTEFNRLQNLD